MSKPFFVMRNNHAGNCGEPPTVSNESPGTYHGYFENPFGEQWVFVYDRASKMGQLRGGDDGWENVFQVIDGRGVGVILGEEESQWLLACWHAATGERS